MKVLLLAGTGEARAMADALVQRDGIEVTASLAGATRTPEALPCATRVGGFGGAAGLTDYLNDHQIDTVVDATHPFAATISATAATVCKRLGLPFAQILRPVWTATRGDRWIPVAAEEDTANVIDKGATVFLATGRQSLDRFSNLTGSRMICRRIDPPRDDFPYPNGRWQVGKPPFSVDEEIELFTAEAIDWLVVKNSGGEASRSKLDAARALGIPVVVIDRPAQPDCTRFESVAATLQWIDALMAKS